MAEFAGLKLEVEIGKLKIKKKKKQEKSKNKTTNQKTIKKIEESDADNVNSLCIEISKLINSLINTLSPKYLHS